MTSATGAPTIDHDDELATARGLLDKDPRQSLNRVQQLLSLNPDPRLFRIAAEACRRLGLHADAESAELAGIQAGFRVPELIAAAEAGADGHNSDAQNILEQFLRNNGDDLLALTMAAEADIHSWKLERGEDRLRIVLERAPKFLRAILLLADSLTLQARIREAIDVVTEAARRKPRNLAILQSLAQLAAEARDHERAAETYAQMLTVDRDRADFCVMYAQQLRMLGRKDDAVAAFRRALSLDPDSGAAWWGLTNYFVSELTDADVKAMMGALARRAGAPEDEGPLHIALSIVAERNGDHAEAFRHVSTGKALREKMNGYDPDVVAGEVDRMLRVYTSALFAEHENSGFPDDSPIFIIGMPRSGSTLLERILGCHSKIEAGGELPIMPRLHERLRHEDATGYPERVPSMSPDEFTKLGARYRERSRDYRSTDKPRFVDKLNTNWFHVGLIRLMLPKARIIDIRRGALDCCWSNYKMLFAEGHVAANDMRHIARYYRDYVRLVDGIVAASPGAILRVHYEELVDDIEAQARRIFDFLGLDFESACIDFHLAEGAVATPSSEQVRRPLNRDSIRSAAPYLEWLGPMIEELGELAGE